MDSFREKNGGLSSDRPAGEQLGRQNRTRTCDLEPRVNREEKESVTAKAGLSHEVKRAHSEFDKTAILSAAKATARPSDRRRKIRVWLP